MNDLKKKIKEKEILHQRTTFLKKKMTEGNDLGILVCTCIEEIKYKNENTKIKIQTSLPNIATPPPSLRTKKKNKTKNCATFLIYDLCFKEPQIYMAVKINNGY